VLKKVPADAKIIPGHGALGTREDLEKFSTMLTKTTDFVKAEIAKGMTLEQAKAAGLPDEWKPWGGGYITVDGWVEAVYTSLKP